MLSKHLLENPKQRNMRKLRPYCVKVCDQLAEEYNLVCSHASVAKELSGLMHEISKPLHSRVKAPAGYFVGGPSPLAQAIACLIDDGGKIVCRLAHGNIQRASEPRG